MSIQEIGYETAFDGVQGPVGHIDIFGKNIYANSIVIDKPYLNRPKQSIYVWNFNLPIEPSPSQTVNGIFSCVGLGQGTLTIPSQAQLDAYFGTTNKGYVFSVEVLNATANALSIINNGSIILNIASGTPLNPTYNKYYFSKVNDNQQYLCVNNTNLPF